MVATHLWVPESPIKSPARVDYGGAALLSAGLTAFLLAVSEGNRWGWGSARIIGLFVAAAVLLVVWVLYEQRVSEPLVDIDLLRLRGVWTTNLTGFLIGFGMFGSFILVPQFVQMPEASGYGFGVGVLGAGLFMLPSTAVMLVAGPLAGSLAGRVGSKVPLLIGTACASASFLLLSAGPLGAVAHRPGGGAPRPRHRALLRLDGEPHRRSGAAAPDRRGHRHEHDHAHRRRRVRRSDRGRDHHEPPRAGHGLPDRGRLHDRIRARRRLRGRRVRGGDADPRSTQAVGTG